MLIKRYSKLVDLADRFLMSSRNKQARVEESKPLFVVVLKTVLRDIVESIRNCRCPYCGARIKPKGYLALHIKKVHYSRYFSDIVKAVDAYENLVNMLVHSGKGWTIKMNGVVLKGYKADIARKIEEDPTILTKLGVI
jgi:DNA-directed RNA polymerase subunit RPC12/RpoP